MDLKETEAAFRDLISVIERDRDSLIQRSPLYRRDIDNALGAAQSALKYLGQGKADIARTLWLKNPALRLIARNFDVESDRITAAFE
jgi:hypothetical protein